MPRLSCPIESSKPASETPPAAIRRRLQLPAAARPVTVNWRYAIVLTLVHLLALLALHPWFFSWTGVWLAAIGYYVFGMLGVNVTFHRLLSHRSFACPKWLEYWMALLGVCCLQESPVRWVAIHRMHHRHSDRQSDPHSPQVNLVWGHVGWLFLKNRDHWEYDSYARYARDLLRQPFYSRVEKNLLALWIYLGHAAFFFVAGCAAGWLLHGTRAEALQFGLSILVWGVFVRTVLFQHATWAVNAGAHRWGYRNFATRDNSRNHVLLGLLAHGDGWHNNHHAHQRLAMHGRRWWEVDPSYWFICLLERLGLAYNVRRPSARFAAQAEIES